MITGKGSLCKILQDTFIYKTKNLDKVSEVVIAGKNDIACNILDHMLLWRNIAKLYVVPNSTDTGKDGWQRSLKCLALKLGVHICTLDQVQELENCIFISCEYEKIIRPSLFKTTKLFNMHFSLLPKYKGMYTSCLPILHGERMSGVTLHKIDKGIDTGDIIDQIKFSIEESDVASDLYNKYTYHAFDLFKRNIQKLIEGTYISYPQPAQGSTYYSKLAVDFSNIVVDYKQTAHQIKNQIHAYSFIHYQLPKFKDIEIISAKVTNDKSTLKPSEEVSRTSVSITISTIDYNIVLLKHIRHNQNSA